MLPTPTPPPLPPAPLSRRVASLHASPIRQILSVAQRPGIVSFAGGLPDPASFPDLSLSPLPADCLQYGPSEGEAPLREQISQDLARIGLACPPGRVLVLSGSQQGIDLVAKLFVDPGTPVAVESPTYLAALQVFRFFGARFVALDAGPAQDEWGAEGRPSLAYAIPTFQNPTGACRPAAARDELARRCDAWGVPLFEDDPYRDLAYESCERTPVCARLRRASWVYQGSFSKSLAPGLRLGFLASSADLAPHLAILKQAADPHSNRVSQHLVLQQLRDPGRAARLAALAGAYRRKRDAFDLSLRCHFGALAQWETPAGGLFFWLRLKRAIDTRALLPDAIAQGVAFMPGEPFYPAEPVPGGTLRLNFSHAGAADADRGLGVLARLVERRLD